MTEQKHKQKIASRLRLWYYLSIYQDHSRCWHSTDRPAPRHGDEHNNTDYQTSFNQQNTGKNPPRRLHTIYVMPADNGWLAMIHLRHFQQHLLLYYLYKLFNHNFNQTQKSSHLNIIPIRTIIHTPPHSLCTKRWHTTSTIKDNLAPLSVQKHYQHHRQQQRPPIQHTTNTNLRCTAALLLSR